MCTPPRDNTSFDDSLSHLKDPRVLDFIKILFKASTLVLEVAITKMSPKMKLMYLKLMVQYTQTVQLKQPPIDHEKAMNQFGV